jgi:hypothetical protein
MLSSIITEFLNIKVSPNQIILCRIGDLADFFLFHLMIY